VCFQLFPFKCAHIFISKAGVSVFQVGRAGLALTEEQKIKLSIARAVLLNPSILLLDEVTGGLDFEAERAVQEALDLLMLGRSTIIIARRLSLIKNADYIAVMDEGLLVEMGTHDELSNLNGLYAELLRCEEAAKLPKRYLKKSYSFLCQDIVFFSKTNTSMEKVARLRIINY